MSTISKEAIDAADAEHAEEYRPVRNYIGYHIQRLLDAKKSESEKVSSALRSELMILKAASEMSVDVFHKLEQENHDLRATITELRAACAEKDAALSPFSKAAVIYPISQYKNGIPNCEWPFALEALWNATTVLSSHGESILAEIARLKEDARLNELAFYDQNTKFLKCIEEKEALRARAESAEKNSNRLTNALDRVGFYFAGNDEYNHVSDKILAVLGGKTIDEACRASIAASQPPQQGDKAPS